MLRSDQFTGSPLRAHLVVAALVTSMPAVGGGAEEGRGGAPELDLKSLFYDHIPESPFVDVVYGYADAMLAHGRREGPGSFFGALDRATFASLELEGQAPANAAGALHDQNLLRLLYFLRGLSGEDRYPQAADRALVEHLRAAAAAGDTFPWGRGGDGDEAAGFAFHRPWLLWGRCFELAPEESRRFALRLWEGRAGGGLAGREGAPREAGFLIRTWAEAYAHGGDPVFLAAIDAVLKGFEGGVGETGEGAPARVPASALLSLAIDADGAARKVPAGLRDRLRAVAAGVDELFCALPHRLAEKGGFAAGAAADGRGRDGGFTPRWEARRPGSETTARVAMMCVSRYHNTGKTAYRNLVVAAADAYLESLPGEGSDAWPGTLGQAISLELAAFRETARDRYFDRATRLGEVAVARFFDGSPLPRASLQSKRYENTTGADTLVLALADLHLVTRTITAVRAPVNTADR